jgi:hypothetical protein
VSKFDTYYTNQTAQQLDQAEIAHQRITYQVASILSTNPEKEFRLKEIRQGLLHMNGERPEGLADWQAANFNRRLRRLLFSLVSKGLVLRRQIAGDGNRVTNLYRHA